MTQETKSIIMKALSFYDSKHGGIRGTDGFVTARARMEVQSLPDASTEEIIDTLDFLLDVAEHNYPKYYQSTNIAIALDLHMKLDGESKE